MHTVTETKAPYSVDADNSPVSVFAAIKDVLPMSIHNKMMHIRDEHDRLQWVVGDLFNEIYAYVKANEVEATRPDVASYLLFNLGMDGERSFSSVLIDAAAAAFYPVEARRKYALLPFSHFRFAAGFGVDAGEVLDTALNFLDQYGRPPSRRWLEKQYEYNGLTISAKANEIGAAHTPSASALYTGSYGAGLLATNYQPPAQPVQNVRYHVNELKSAVVNLPGTNSQIIARIVALCDEALEHL